jgi:uncharacterized membrane protein
MKFILPFLIAIILFSCGQEGSNDQSENFPDSTKTNENNIYGKDSAGSAQFADSLPTGAYRGMLPCIDCKYIQQTIVFDTNMSYKEERVKAGNNELPQRSTGNWQSQNGEIVLIENGKIDVTLLKKNDTLYFISMNGDNLINPDRYILTKVNLADDEVKWNKKRKEGIDFVAMGNNPVWNLEIYNAQYISFKASDWQKPVFLAAKEPIENKDSSVYSLKKDTSKLMITILPQTCIDSSTDVLYQYTVNVHYKGFLYKGCGIMLSKKKLAIKLSKFQTVHKTNYR